MRALSTKMKDILMDCHEREILKQDPRSTYYSRYSKGLLKRGLLTAKPFIRHGKTFMAFFITPEGIEYLSKIG